MSALRNLDLRHTFNVWEQFANHRVRHTPDAAKLFANKTWRLFVCDGHQSKHEHFPQMLKHGPTLFPGYSNYPTVFTMKGFSMFYDHPSKQVVPLYTENDGSTSDFLFPCAKIKGQLHLVTPDLIHSLDIVYQNGVQFRRRRVKLLLPYYQKLTGPNRTLNGKPLPRALQGWRGKTSPERICVVDAYMYVGVQKFWNDKLDGGYDTLQCPIQFPNVEKNWLPRYYEYTRTFEEVQRSNS